MIGINDMQQTWQNFGMGGGGGGSYGSGNMMGNFNQAVNLTGTQTPGAVTNTQNAMSGYASVPGVNQVQMPSWLSTNPNANLGELTQTYANIGTTFDPTQQIAARNAAIGYNTSAGNQAATNAATQYANQAAQSGASGLGAGTVKAQNLMPVLSQNAQLRTQAADVAAQTYQAGAQLAAQIGSTIGQLRTSYLSTLAGYSAGQQSLALDKYKAQQAAAGQAAQISLGYAQTRADQYKAMMSAQQQGSSSALAAAQALMNYKPNLPQYEVGLNGQPFTQQDTSSYNLAKSIANAKGNAVNTLNQML